MWVPIKEQETEETIRYQIAKDGRLISFSDWIENIQDSVAFIEFFIELFKNCNLEAYFWEVKPVVTTSLAEPFEFVLVSSKILVGIEADFSSFHQYFNSEEAVVAFPNLRGDAQLVVPAPLDEQSDYAHLAKFMRNAPSGQLIGFWQQVGKEYEKRIGPEIKWLSTAGLGVSWLHVRIDSRPKYYRHREYKSL